MPIDMLIWTLNDVFKSAHDLFFFGVFAVLGKAKYHYVTIDHSAPVEKGHLELNLWPWPLTFTLTSIQVERWQNRMTKHVSSLFDLWPMTFLQSQPRPRTRSTLMPNIEDIGQTDGQTDRQMDKRTDATKRIISPASRSTINQWSPGQWLILQDPGYYLHVTNIRK